MSNRYKGKKFKRKAYSNAEKIAFRLGQEARVLDSIASKNTNSRVYEAYDKGYTGKVYNPKKPLFGN